MDTGATVTIGAELLDSATSAPEPDRQISFRVIGANSGASGYCNTSLCSTAADGTVRWYYVGTRTGTDTVQAWLDIDGDASPSVGEPQTIARVEMQAGTKRNLVTLGDSFSAGEGAGVGNYFLTNGKVNKCHRASTAWSFELAKTSRTINDNVENAACTGAKTAHVLTDWYKGEQPQVDRLKQLVSRQPVDLVAVEIGGNDIGFAGIARNCYLVDCTKELNQKAGKIALLETKMRDEVLPKLKAAAPKAQVVVVGYPRLLPSQQAETTGCGWLKPLERQALNTLVTQLNLALRRAATTAGTDFADIEQALDQHEMCSRDSYVVPVSGSLADSQQAHPNARGHKRMAAEIYDELLRMGLIAG